MADCPCCKTSVSRRPSSKRLFRGFFLIPTTLAFSTCLLILLYVSSTSNFFFHTRKVSTFLNPTFTLQAPKDSFLIQSGNFSSPSQFQTDSKSSTFLGLSETTDQLGVSDDDSEFPPPSSSSKDDDEFASQGSHMYEDDYFHDKEVFLKNYLEMNRSLKIYVYPHKKSHPFANVLLPVNAEPGGNYASETYFKNVLMKSHFVTNDPKNADLFFLPFSIAGLRNDKRVGVGGLPDFVRDYITYIKQNFPYWNRTGGADHFYVACHSIGRVAMQKADDVKSNAIQVVCSSSYFLPNYFAHKDVGLPQVWPRKGHPDLALSKREKLAFFAGAMNSPVRKFLYEVWKNDGEIFAHNGRLPTPYADQLLGSKYCLHVKGFEVNTARLADAMYYGCVPVIIADYYDLPFMDILNWRSFSVVVKVSDIPNLKKILKGIGSEEYAMLQRNVLKARKHFQWNHAPTDYDAFYTVMYELWLRRSTIRVFLDD